MTSTGLHSANHATAAKALTDDEQACIDGDPWFAGLATDLRTDMLSRGAVRRVKHGTLLASRGQAAIEWFAVAKGAVRLGSVSLSGRPITLAYAEPGQWLGEIGLVDGLAGTHDANAQGDTTLFVIRKPEFKQLLALHPELPEALLQLECRRMRLLYEQIESLATLPLAARLAQQLLTLMRQFGVSEGDDCRIGLQLAQEDLAQMLGASRQRVNRELKRFEREGALRVDASRLVVRSEEWLRSFVASEG